MKMVCEEDKSRFAKICREIVNEPIPGAGAEGSGIGTYNEKRMHMALKRFVCEDPGCYEVDVGNRYIADVMCDGEIYEIQTGSLYPLKKKLQYYLDNTDCHVTVVHPVAHKKKVIWIDPATGEMKIPSRGSTHRPGPAQMLPEIIYISEQIASGRVGVWLLMIEEEEYRWLNGWSKDKKRGSDRYERLPVELIDEAAFESPDDYAELIPDGLPENFTAAQFGKAVKGLAGRRLYMALGALVNLGVLQNAAPRGRAKTFTRRK